MFKPYLLLALLISADAYAELNPPKRDLALASVSAITTDLTSGEVLVEKHADVVLPVASITKVMT
ncbi:MAG: hypothetical protein O3A63_10420, partial [Proteobacteria bacterium]|nr:hypothetical protein [Pseudomonadota bacterium]